MTGESQFPGDEYTEESQLQGGEYTKKFRLSSGEYTGKLIMNTNKSLNIPKFKLISLCVQWTTRSSLMKKPE
jgi:hypothetical protein